MLNTLATLRGPEFHPSWYFSSEGLSESAKLANDGDGPLGTGQTSLLLLVVVLLGEEKRSNDGEDGEDDSGAVGLLK